MSLPRDESSAYRQTLLKSERLCILILFIAIGIAILARLIGKQCSDFPFEIRTRDHLHSARGCA
jgi:hypothetical protein